MMLQDSECSRERFQSLIAQWYPHWQEFKEKGKCSKELAQPRSAENVLDLIESTVFGKPDI